MCHKAKTNWSQSTHELVTKQNELAPKQKRTGHKAKQKWAGHKAKTNWSQSKNELATQQKWTAHKEKMNWPHSNK
jgi:hypothetical protein